MKIKIVTFLLAISYCGLASAQGVVKINQYSKAYTTYPFSDPDPVANDGKIYPYFRYDGFTDSPVKKTWQVVELENDYIKVQIMPEIGGKIWTAIDKKNNRPFLYENGVVKFRDIAMRGPWTSGGIEANFGIIGHTPAVATPVDYLVRNNKDGSASCFISNLDLLTRSQWVVEIRLPRDKAYFVTHVNWHNSSPVTEPYYSWMNLAVKASDSLHFIDPGTHYIGHAGEVGDWPMDSVNNKDISIYGQNNFGSSKSYHIMGKYSQYFGAYWPEENYGMIHFAAREDKLGKKVFLWALSDAGKVWERLLTDKSGQYVEIQSGRSFNQNAFKSSYSPFKQRGFLPYQSDQWSEYWYPFSQTGGVGIADLNGVFDMKQHGDSLTISISPVSRISDTLFLYDDHGNILFSEKITLTPMEPFSKTISLKASGQPIELRFENSHLKLNDSAQKDLKRPLKPYPDFDWESAYGLYLLGRDAANQRTYDVAESYIRKSLDKEPSFMPAMVQMSSLQYRKMNYDSAFYFAQKALSVDTYDPGANFYYGLASKALGRYYDAQDGFETASLSMEFRNAALTEKSKLYFKKGDYSKADEYAGRSLEYNARNTTSLQLKLLSARMMNRLEDVERIKEKILEIDPSNHFVAFENYWQKKDAHSRNLFTAAIRSELPAQTYLEMAVWYYNLGRLEESRAILEMAPRDNEIQYWQAFLDKDGPKGAAELQAADNGDPLMVYPFREESAGVMQWAMKNTADFKPRYYLALIQSFRNNKEIAKQLLTDITTPVAFSPFYIERARLYGASEDSKKQDDINKAISLNENQWRYRKLLAEYYLKTGDNKAALDAIETYYKSHSDNYIIGMVYVQALMANQKFAASEKVLANIHILPFEGATNGHRLYKRTKLMLALDALKNRQYKKAGNKVAEAKQWPMNLGEGKPFPENIDTSLEDKIGRIINDAQKDRNLKINYEELGKEIFSNQLK